MNPTENCPLTGIKGTLRRVRPGQELAASYASYFGKSIPEELVKKYFAQTIHEYQCDQSGMRWYAPARLGESEFYEWLAEVFPWYYDSAPTWDKLAVLDFLQRFDTRGFVEAGSGGGVFLRLARDCGIKGIGTEINIKAIEACRREGLAVYHADENPTVTFPIDTLVSVQSLEHVIDPCEYLRTMLAKFPVQRLVIAVPCFETLLGRTLDPLAWPPHHYTAWSKKSLATIGHLLGYKLEAVRYEPLSFDAYCGVVDRERAFQKSQVPVLPWRGMAGKILFRVLQYLRFTPLLYRHSIVVVLSRRTS